MDIARYLLLSLAECGVDTVFGNPGTTEIPLLTAFGGLAPMRYVVALSEVAAVPMADGYARAKRSLGVVNLHVAPGLGNGMGSLYTARIAKTPLLALVGGQDRRLAHTAPVLHGPLDAMAASVCKSVFRLSERAAAPATVRDALRAVLAPPHAPVALVCPPDLLQEQTDAEPQRVHAPQLAGLDADQARELAATLVRAQRPAFVAAEEVHWHGAAAELAALAQALDAPVYVAPYTGVLPVDARSPAFAGHLSPSFEAIATRLAEHDLIVFIGGRNLRTTLYSAPRLPARKLWLGDDPGVLASAGEHEQALLVDLRRALASLAGTVRERLGVREAAPRSWRPKRIPAPASAPSLHPTQAIDMLLDRFPDAILVDEAGLSTSDIRQAMSCRAGDYLTNGSGGIGWGLAAAVGAALARPERQVLAIVGDGSSLYASEALWSAGHYGARVLLVVLSNRRYATLNAAASRLAGRSLEAFTLEPPALDFAGLARLYGCDFLRARTREELEAAVRALGAAVSRNTVLELVLDPALAPVTASRHF